LDLILSPLIIQILAAVILIVLCLTLLRSWQFGLARQRVARQAQQLELEHWQHKVNTALLRYQDASKATTTWSGIRKFEVAKRVQECKDVVSFYLRPHDKKTLPAFQPGQFLTFEITLPGETRPTRRCYSLSDSPYDTEMFRITIKRIAAGRISNYFHDEIQEGDILDVRAPNGNFFLDISNPRPVVLIAGGVGITPLLSMINTLVQDESGAQRETWLFYGVRSGEHHLMKDHLHRLTAEYARVNIIVCYSEPGPDDRKGEDYHHEGHVSVDLLKRYLSSNNYQFFICGPTAMMGDMTDQLKSWQVPDNDIHTEAFAAATIKQLQGEEISGEAMEIVFAKSQRSMQWGPECGSILDLAESNDLFLDSGCRAGNCGACVVAVRSGEVTYLSDPGANIEQGSCLTCIAVPKTKLELDA